MSKEVGLLQDMVKSVHEDVREGRKEQSEIRKEIAEVREIAVETREQTIRTNGRVTALEAAQKEAIRIRVNGFSRLKSVEEKLFGTEQKETSKRWWADFWAKNSVNLITATATLLISLLALWRSSGAPHP